MYRATRRDGRAIAYFFSLQLRYLQYDQKSILIHVKSRTSDRAIIFKHPVFLQYEEDGIYI